MNIQNIMRIAFENIKPKKDEKQFIEDIKRKKATLDNQYTEIANKTYRKNNLNKGK